MNSNVPWYICLKNDQILHHANANYFTEFMSKNAPTANLESEKRYCGPTLTFWSRRAKHYDLIENSSPSWRYYELTENFSPSCRLLFYGQQSFLRPQSFEIFQFNLNFQVCFDRVNLKRFQKWKLVRFSNLDCALWLPPRASLCAASVRSSYRSFDCRSSSM